MLIDALDICGREMCATAYKINLSLIVGLIFRIVSQILGSYRATCSPPSIPLSCPVVADLVKLRRDSYLGLPLIDEDKPVLLLLILKGGIKAYDAACTL